MPEIYKLKKFIKMLNKTEIYNLLRPEIIKKLNKLDILQLISSTNDYLLEHAHAKLLPNYACVAEGQTQGRGRLGRKWISPYGANLYFSIYWHFNLQLSAFSGLSLAIGVAVLKAIQNFTQNFTNNNQLSLKWPNDLYYGDSKLGGILVELYPIDQTRYAAIIGIGLNLISTGLNDLALLSRPVSCLEDVLGYKLSKNKLTAALINHLIPVLNEFELSGFPGVKSFWEQYDYLKGKCITLDLPQGSVEGLALGVSNKGELCLEIEGQACFFQCGEADIQLKNKS